MDSKKKKVQLYKDLNKIYYKVNEPGSFGGANRLLTEAKSKGLKVTEKDIKNYLADQASYSLHKPARKRFKRNPTVVKGIDQQWQADLADMQGISKTNDGVKYLLTVIDVFSKYAWAIPVKNKGTIEMVEAFKILLKKSAPRKPEKLQTDAGLEFVNKEVQKFLKSQCIIHFVSSSDQKASIAERFNRTLKTRIWTYFTAEQTTRYIEKLDEFLDSYNNSVHRSIKMKPCEVTKKDEDQIWLTLYGNRPRSNAPKSIIGQKVRISKVKALFEKGYMPNWSEEHFHVRKEIKRKRPVYKLEDDMGEEIKGEFYKEEVQPIVDNRCLVEKILKKRKNTGISELFVKWKGWPSKFNSWIKAKDLPK